MFRKTMAIILASLTMTLSATGLQSNFITYDWLAHQAELSAYTDHIPHWRRLFNTTKVRGFLECGCGYSTAYFMDHADKVISIEYITPGYGDDWYQVCVSLFADRSNWIPMTYNADFRSNSFSNACAYQCSTHRDYALIDATYLNELNRHFKEQIINAQDNGYPIDVAFVDPGVYVRGDLVKVLLNNNVPIVVAHDTASDNGTREVENLYGWNKVATPLNYVKIYIPYGQGTTFWINTQYPTVISSIQAYSDAIQQMKDNGSVVGWDDVTRIADAD